MTEAEIKKALECCADETGCAKGCPFFDKKKSKCKVASPYGAFEKLLLDLINHQQAEIERLKDENLQSEYPARIRVDDFFVCANSLGEWLEFCDSLKAEAIKEFAERLKENCKVIGAPLITNRIDNLVKEMVGDASEKSLL